MSEVALSACKRGDTTVIQGDTQYRGVKSGTYDDCAWHIGRSRPADSVVMSLKSYDPETNSCTQIVYNCSYTTTNSYCKNGQDLKGRNLFKKVKIYTYIGQSTGTISCNGR